MAYRSLGLDYSSMGEVERSRQYFARAFELRHRASERERLEITAAYYRHVTGELEKAAQTFHQELEIYPREVVGYIGLAIVSAELGEHLQAIAFTRQAMQLSPGRLTWYEGLCSYAMALQQFDQARQVAREAEMRNFDSPQLHTVRYALGFLQRDEAAMAEQQRWFHEHPESLSTGLALAAGSEAYAGHVQQASQLTRQAAEAAARTGHKEDAGWYAGLHAQQLAAYGRFAGARRTAAAALRWVPGSKRVESEAALAFAMAGDVSRAGSLVRALEKQYPADTQIQRLWLPAIRAQIALANHKSALALIVPQAEPPLSLAQTFGTNVSCLYPQFVRGQAYLAAADGSHAAEEFQTIAHHPGITWNCWTAALAQLGEARAWVLRANALAGVERENARRQALLLYAQFLNGRKDADPGLPVMGQAMREYAKLQQSDHR
jgi:tetratricopeptide (TPR) repeat protein